jgi:uncharacterized membrane protein YhaH (DUF805 family)
MSVSTILFSFEGRIHRGYYWPGAVGVFGASLFLVFVLATMTPEEAISPGVMLLILVLSTFVLWSSLALAIKRLHDCGYSGWCVLLSCIPIFGWLWFLAISLMRGTAGSNRFGPDPVMMPVQPTVPNTHV